MYKVVLSKRYRRSYKKFLSSALNTPSARHRLAEVLEILAAGKVLPARHKDHQLIGELSIYRECHIKDDLLLMYTYEEDVLVLLLVEIGTHSQIFE